MAKTALILVVPGTKIPKLPVQVRESVSVEKVAGQYHGQMIIDRWDEWRILGATAGFSPRGTIRLQAEGEKDRITWLDQQYTRRVYAIKNGQPWTSFNYGFCYHCQKISLVRIKKQTSPIKPKRDFVWLHCPICSANWRVEKKLSKKKVYDQATIRKSSRPRVRTKRFV